MDNEYESILFDEKNPECFEGYTIDSINIKMREIAGNRKTWKEIGFHDSKRIFVEALGLLEEQAEQLALQLSEDMDGYFQEYWDKLETNMNCV